MIAAVSSPGDGGSYSQGPDTLTSLNNYAFAHLHTEKKLKTKPQRDKHGAEKHIYNMCSPVTLFHLGTKE